MGKKDSKKEAQSQGQAKGPVNKGRGISLSVIDSDPLSLLANEHWRLKEEGERTFSKDLVEKVGARIIRKLYLYFPGRFGPFQNVVVLCGPVTFSPLLIKLVLTDYYDILR
jgi:hypothetical protein